MNQSYMRLILLILSGLLLAALTSCGKEDEPTPVIEQEILKIEQNSYAVSSAANSLEIIVQANVNIAVISSESWVHVAMSQAPQTKGIILTIDENTTAAERKAVLTVKGKTLAETITITQSQNDVLEIGQKSYNVSSDESKLEIRVKSNMAYEVTSSESWVHINKSRSLVYSTITALIDGNTTAEERKAVITIKGETMTETITINQSQNDVLEIEQTSYNVASEESKLEIRVKSNIDYEVTSSESWIHVATTRALQTKIITLTIDENKAKKEREATVIVSGHNIERIITILQEAAKTSAGGGIDDMPIVKL